ncbi:MAG TPA: serine/threonine-protein kinase, partial [Pyrinomonadaceae bacterium]|nr:serine/threonine-protein kinase [Pyrinomonadaceae bacterium]
MQVNLKVTAGPYKGRIFSFAQPDTFLIGRNPEAHLCLPDDRYFSRNHCLLEMNPPHSFLRDLGSTNGTFLNGQRVKDASLNNGDRIQCGETILVVEVTTTDLSETTQDSGLPKRPVLVMVECLNCGRREQAQASAPDEHLTFLCEDCRIELKHSPQAIPGYDTVKLLGRGGMGSVMLSREQQTGRAVAIKTLLPEFAVSDKAMKRFMREIDVAAALKHKNIVEFIDRGTHNGVVYLVTEFVDGADACKL